MLADALLPPGHDRGERHRGGRRTRFHERCRAIHRDRLSLSDAHRVHLAGVSEESQLRASEVPEWAFLSIVRDRNERQVRPAHVDEVPSNAEPVQDARAEALDDGIGMVGKREEGGDSVFRLQIEFDRTLVGVVVEECAALFGVSDISRERAELARRVAAGALYLDDICAEISQQLRGVRTADVLRKVDNRQTVKWTGHVTSAARVDKP